MATFITPATVAKWDDSKRTNFAEHVAAKVALADPRGGLRMRAGTLPAMAPVRAF